MENSEVENILRDKNIIVHEKINFKNDDEKINFLNKIELLEKNEVKFKFLNQDLVSILIRIDFNEELLEKFKIINWTNFNDFFLKEKLNKIEKKIYENFIHFLKIEFNILKDDEKSNDKSLFEVKKKVAENFSDKKTNTNFNIFFKREKFDVESDLEEKVKKYDIDVLFNYVEKPHKISVNDFTLYFNQRLRYFSNLLKNRVNLDLDNLMRISQLREINNTNTDVSVIGLINDISETKNGHTIITIEDNSGEIKCFVNKEKKEMISVVKSFCLDEGIGIRGKMGDKIIWVDEIITPTVPNDFEMKSTDNDGYFVVISDLHFGAKVFVDEAFQRFLDWINGKSSNENMNKIAEKIKYVIIPGDIIEGIGIYPGQGADARILYSELQYHEAARWLNQIPMDKAIIIIPGNHDSVRLSEPQPRISYEKAYPLYNMENVIILSNPSRINIFNRDSSGGINIYLYHGWSIFYYADKIQHLRENGGAKKPEEVIKYLLEKRHLAPSHGSNLYIPDSQNDPLVIKKMPDFFVIGHTHKLSLANFKGCTIISGGCWVEMSDYQEKMGMFPDIGKCVICNTKTRKVKILNFYTEKHKLESGDMK